ncbi:MAG TPA: poly-beta-1,6-N-acetyl-D-glucosamine biosynthesis protein PgaD [Lysobacter sp.]|nr:poly-beta-1,6-N-acetyl-D-glucosamine biosynthesis protein PgaD [Lysobacter sp.]
MSTPSPAENPYIYAPRNRASAATRTLHSVLTLAAWALYAYLWLPVLTVLAWVLGVRTSYVELYVRNNRFDNSIFLVILVLALVATVLLVGWAEYNRRKFGGPDRRSTPHNVGSHDVAQSLFASPELSQRLVGAKSVTLNMGEDARLAGIHRHTPLNRST